MHPYCTGLANEGPVVVGFEGRVGRTACVAREKGEVEAEGGWYRIAGSPAWRVDKGSIVPRKDIVPPSIPDRRIPSIHPCHKDRRLSMQTHQLCSAEGDVTFRLAKAPPDMPMRAAIARATEKRMDIAEVTMSQS